MIYRSRFGSYDTVRARILARDWNILDLGHCGVRARGQVEENARHIVAIRIDGEEVRSLSSVRNKTRRLEMWATLWSGVLATGSALAAGLTYQRYRQLSATEAVSDGK